MHRGIFLRLFLILPIIYQAFWFFIKTFAIWYIQLMRLVSASLTAAKLNISFIIYPRIKTVFLHP